eukprot:TRINITY_DN17545_c0_g1_i1.p1 TRINITY_DN17545_c0_g1~~TRINITY_DN17545_c0_g1_i1.p1  ORF type:complete len:308 (+),score=87.86 TRINITY_DN17545_c0_g1_i1:209-1132(+)
MSDDPSSLYRDYVHQHDGTAVAPAPERDFVSSDELNAAAAEHGGEVFDQNKNQEARDAAADLASGDSNDPSAMYRNYARSHKGTGVAPAPGRDLSSSDLDAAAAVHGGEVFSDQVSAVDADEAAKVVLSPRANTPALHSMPAGVKAAFYVHMSPTQRAELEDAMSAEERSAMMGVMSPSQKSELSSQNRVAYRQQLEILRSYRSQSNPSPTQLQSLLLSEGLALAPEQEPKVLASLKKDPAKTIIVVAGLPVAPAQTIRTIRRLILPNLEISTKLKLELQREIVLNPSAYDVGLLRDRLVEAVTHAL